MPPQAIAIPLGLGQILTSGASGAGATVATKGALDSAAIGLTTFGINPATAAAVVAAIAAAVILDAGNAAAPTLPEEPASFAISDTAAGLLPSGGTFGAATSRANAPPGRRSGTSAAPGGGTGAAPGGGTGAAPGGGTGAAPGGGTGAAPGGGTSTGPGGATGGAAAGGGAGSSSARVSRPRPQAVPTGGSVAAAIPFPPPPPRVPIPGFPPGAPSGKRTSTGSSNPAGKALGGRMPSYRDPNMRGGGGVKAPLSEADLPPGVYAGEGWYYRTRSITYDYFQLPTKIYRGDYIQWGRIDSFSRVRSFQLESERRGEYGYLLYSRTYLKIAPDGTVLSDKLELSSNWYQGAELAEVDLFPVGTPDFPQAGGGTAAYPAPPVIPEPVPTATATAPGMPLPGIPTSTGTAAGGFSNLNKGPIPTAAASTPALSPPPIPTAPAQTPAQLPSVVGPGGQNIPGITPTATPTPGLNPTATIGPGPGPTTAAAASPPGIIPITGIGAPAAPQNPPTVRPSESRCDDPCVQRLQDRLSGLSDLVGNLFRNFFGDTPTNQPLPVNSSLAVQLGNISDQIDAIQAGGGVDLSPLLQALAEKVDELGAALGVDEFPATVPTTLISKQGTPDQTKQLANLAQFLAWQIEQIDALFGQWEIPIEIEDTDLTKAGNQSQKIRLPNLAEATAEQMGLLLNLTTTVNALTEISMRTLTESGLAHKEAAIAHIYGRENAQYLAYEGKEVEIKIPFSFTPGAKTLEDTLKNVELPVRAWENVDKKDLKYYFNDFLSAAAIIRAVYWQKLDPKKDLTKQIIDLVKGADKFTKPSEDDNDDFDNFLDRVETGFTGATGITDSTHPYGRDTTRRPRIRKLGQTKDDGGTIGGNLGGT